MIIFDGEDLKRLFVSKSRKIARFSLYCTLLAFLIFLFSPLRYQSWATFKQSSTRADMNFDIKNIIRNFSPTGSEGSSISLMLSNTILGKTAEKLGLQAELKVESTSHRLVRHLITNLLAEIGAKPQAPTQTQFSDIVYHGEIPLALKFKRISDKDYEIYDKRGYLIKRGSLGEWVDTPDFQFTIHSIPASVPYSKHLPLILKPISSVVPKLRKRISIKVSREDKNLLSITCKDAYRKQSTSIVNTLMEMYEKYLIEENKVIIGSQLSYLRQRQTELSQKLDQDIQDHAEALKKNLQSEGFLGIKDEVQFILEPLQTYQHRLNGVEIELRQINQRLAKPGLLLDSTQNKSKLMERYTLLIGGQIASAQDLLKQVREQKPLQLPQSLDSLQSIVQEFNQALQDCDKNLPLTQLSFQSKQRETESVLQHLLHHLTSREQSLSEGNQMVESLESDLTGIRLDSARSLFDNYSRQFNDLHAHMKQIIFIRDHLFDSNFEISTLSNVLSDPVTQHLIHRSSELETQLCDDVNRSVKDRGRLKSTLATYKRFLDSHLEQTLQLSKIRTELIQEHITSLSVTMQTLLQQEKEVLHEKIKELKQSMQALPDLWLHENQLKFKSELTKGMMAGLVQIAETKNLSDYLYQVESRPLDKAFPPLSPVPPRLIVKTLMALMLSSLVCGLFFFLQSLVRGIPVSLATLEKLGNHTSGRLSFQSPLSIESDQDTETLQRLTSFLMEDQKNRSKTVAVLGEKQTQFLPALTRFLKRHQQKSCIVDCSFRKIVFKEEEEGLFQALKGDSLEPLLRHFDTYDLLPVGSSSNASVELIQSTAFKALVQQLSDQYDYIFLWARIPIDSLEADLLTDYCSSAIISVETSLTLLQKKIDIYRQKENKRVTLIQYPILIET